MLVTIRPVGGCVRDELAGKPTKDWDFNVEIPALVGEPVEVGFEAMRAHLVAQGFEIFVETPEMVTIRARFPRTDPRHAKLTADFRLCRTEGPYSDGRRPDWVKVGTLTEDLGNRDFTVNAMCRGTDGALIDLFGGEQDLADMMLRCVGNPLDRFREDPLRVMRALRFAVTKGFTLDRELSMALCRGDVAKAVAEVSIERREEELRMMFQFDTIATLELFNEITPELRDAALSGVKLNPTHKRRLPNSQGGTE